VVWNNIEVCTAALEDIWGSMWGEDLQGIGLIAAIRLQEKLK
jgi:hypothetical protein